MSGETGRTSLELFVDDRLAALGMSREELAERMGIAAQATLDKKLAGMSELSLKQTRAMALALDTSIEHICTLIEENTR